MNLASGVGLYRSAKLHGPWHSGLLMIGAIVLNSIPAYIEGHKDMRNEEVGRDSQLARRIGFYCLVCGYGIISYKHRYLKY